MAQEVCWQTIKMIAIHVIISDLKDNAFQKSLLASSDYGKLAIKLIRKEIQHFLKIKHRDSQKLQQTNLKRQLSETVTSSGTALGRWLALCFHGSIDLALIVGLDLLDNFVNQIIAELCLMSRCQLYLFFYEFSICVKFRRIRREPAERIVAPLLFSFFHHFLLNFSFIQCERIVIERKKHEDVFFVPLAVHSVVTHRPLFLVVVLEVSVCHLIVFGVSTLAKFAQDFVNWEVWSLLSMKVERFTQTT